MLYHVTTVDRLDSIFGHGLVPAIGPRSAAFGETRARVYLFKDLSGVEDALMGWMSSAFDDVAHDLVVLELEPDEQILASLVESSAGYEVMIECVIHPGCIRRMLDESLQEVALLEQSAAPRHQS